jgi:hypothetical protein
LSKTRSLSSLSSSEGGRPTIMRVKQ